MLTASSNGLLDITEGHARYSMVDVMVIGRQIEGLDD